MNTERDVQVEEQTLLFEKGPSPVVKTADVELKSSNLENDGRKYNALSKNNADLIKRSHRPLTVLMRQLIACKDDRSTVPTNANIEITIWRNRKIYINKSLIPLRAALLLWFASGSLCSPFFFLLLTHRGLELAELSYVFSMISLFQLVVSYICGIIVDKLGNAKVALLCLMLLVISIVIGLLLSPNVRDMSCIESDVNITCFNAFNNTSDLESCKYACSVNNTDYFIFQAVNNNITSFSSYSNATDILRSNEIFQDSFYSNSTVIFCNEICSCFDQSARNCSTTSKIELKILYSCLTLCFFSFMSTTYRFVDLAALTLAKQQSSTYGNERLFGTIGTLVVTVLLNFVLNIDQSGTRGDYDNVYWLAVVLYVLAVISVFNIREIRLPPCENLSKNTLKFFTDIKIISFILVVFVSGTAFNFTVFYNLWFLDSLKASKRIIGIHEMIYPLSGLLICVTSNWWLRKFGREKIMIIGLLGYAIQGTSYSFLYYPWLSLIIVIINAFSYYLFWIATVTHCGEIAPKGFAATVTAVVGTVHFGIGKSFIVPVGGYLISTYGARITYKILSGFCLVTAILYSTFLYLESLFSSRGSENRNKEPEEMESMKENEA